MIRTVAVGIGACLLAAVIFACAVFLIAIHLPQGNYPFYFALEALVGIAVGTFVGTLQRKRAGQLATISLLPVLYLTNQHSQLFTCGCMRAILFLLTDALMLFLAFALAHRLSDIRNSRLNPASSN
jgi:hypothetical protein